MLEKNIKTETPSLSTSFSHMGAEYKIVQSSSFQFAGEEMEGLVTLKILDKNNTSQGTIGGQILILKKENSIIIFKSDYIFDENSERSVMEKNKLSQHTVGVIQETIAQLLIQDKITIWDSSDDLTEKGRHTYDSLSKDPRIEGRKMLSDTPHPNSEEPKYHYLLNKKQV